MTWDARLTADHEIARRLELGVGDDVMVELLHDGKVVGLLRADAYARLQSTVVPLPSLGELVERERAVASGPLHFNLLEGR